MLQLFLTTGLNLCVVVFISLYQLKGPGKENAFKSKISDFLIPMPFSKIKRGKKLLVPVLWVHRCGPGGSMRASHAAGPGSIPGRDKFHGWGFFRGFSSPVRQMSGSFRSSRSPNIIWPSLSSSIIIHYGRQWPEMLTRPKTSNIPMLWVIKVNTIYGDKSSL